MINALVRILGSLETNVRNIKEARRLHEPYELYEMTVKIQLIINNNTKITCFIRLAQ